MGPTVVTITCQTQTLAAPGAAASPILVARGHSRPSSGRHSGQLGSMSAYGLAGSHQSVCTRVGATGGPVPSMPSSSRMRPESGPCLLSGRIPPVRRYGWMTTRPHSPIGAIRVLQLPFVPKYCWVAKAQPLVVGSTETDEKSPNRTGRSGVPGALPPVA